ncbi:rRNA methyltransferase 3, mitochondrial [Culicoides brevitarsis]|uniref:rRNA methyltransferase 3, mitochondrial n=1 Tax=Culicoides brevitarsis TaxID=469753 RepID=UPI00307C50BE
MNYRLIRQTIKIFESHKGLFTSRTSNFAQNPVKSFHFGVTCLAPRFAKDTKEHEIIELPSEEPASDKKPRKPSDIHQWQEVEHGMFHTKKSKTVEIPKMKFKGSRAFVQKDAPFDMNEIDKISKGGKKPKKENFRPPQPKKEKKAPEERYDPDIGNYLKLERDDPIIDKIMMSVTSKKHQEKTERKLVLEGRRLIQEAIEAGLQLETLIFSKIEQVKPISNEILRSKAKKYKVANHNLKLWSQLTTTPGILGIFNLPANFNELIEKRRRPTDVMPVTIILDNIREPNNMGAIIRVAAAAGADQIILTKGCTNPWDLKCIRGSSGTHFSVKIIGPVEWNEVEEHLPDTYNYYIADKESNNEKLPLLDYYSVDFSMSQEGNKHLVLVMGGESHGVSEEAKIILEEILAQKLGNGAIVRIPIVQKVDSLNVASAMSVLLFEIRRQLNLSQNE